MFVRRICTGTHTLLMANVEPPSVKFMRPRRYAERVGINWRSIYQYIAKGELPAYKFRGILLIDVEEADGVLKGLVRHVARVHLPRSARKPRRKRRAEIVTK